ncbi:MAG: type II toxin-antitoxin system antitoxin SocA domain-containing protein [Sphingomonas sp.]
MSLLKIIFYACGWYLAAKNTPLFRQPVEAWEFGPVVKVVRDAFKEFGKNPIQRLAERLDLETGEFVPVGYELSTDDEEFVTDIYSLYIDKSAFELSDMTHEPGSPWDKVWNAKTAVGRLGLRIKNEDIQDYFKLMKVKDTLH